MAKPLKINMDKFIELLESVEKEGNISLRELARKVGVDNSSFTKIKNREVTEVRLSLVGKVCDYLNIDPYEYLESGEHVVNLDRLPAELRQQIWGIILKHAEGRK